MLLYSFAHLYSLLLTRMWWFNRLLATFDTFLMGYILVHRPEPRSWKQRTCYFGRAIPLLHLAFAHFLAHWCMLRGISYFGRAFPSFPYFRWPSEHRSWDLGPDVTTRLLLFTILINRALLNRNVLLPYFFPSQNLAPDWRPALSSTGFIALTTRVLPLETDPASTWPISSGFQARDHLWHLYMNVV